jgi:hypothetical protein
LRQKQTHAILTADHLEIIQEITLMEEASQYQPLACTTCHEYIGHVDQHAEGYRLYKWRLDSTRTDRPSSSQTTSPPESYYSPSIQGIITAQLQSIMLAQCTSKLLLLPTDTKPMNTPTTILSLWILNPTLRYSSTNTDQRQQQQQQQQEQQQQQQQEHDSPTAKLAMKVFWKPISSSTAEALAASESAPSSSKSEEVYLPQAAILELKDILHRSVSYLPPSGRKFQDWHVGLLNRFEREREIVK